MQMTWNNFCRKNGFVKCEKCDWCNAKHPTSCSKRETSLLVHGKQKKAKEIRRLKGCVWEKFAAFSDLNWIRPELLVRSVPVSVVAVVTLTPTLTGPFVEYDLDSQEYWQRECPLSVDLCHSLDSYRRLLKSRQPFSGLYKSYRDHSVLNVWKWMKSCWWWDEEY